jgi:hypothetical protein
MSGAGAELSRSLILVYVTGDADNAPVPSTATNIRAAMVRPANSTNMRPAGKPEPRRLGPLDHGD